MLPRRISLIESVPRSRPGRINADQGGRWFQLDPVVDRVSPGYFDNRQSTRVELSSADVPEVHICC